MLWCYRPTCPFPVCAGFDINTNYEKVPLVHHVSVCLEKGECFLSRHTVRHLRTPSLLWAQLMRMLVCCTSKEICAQYSRVIYNVSNINLNQWNCIELLLITFISTIYVLLWLISHYIHSFTVSITPIIPDKTFQPFCGRNVTTTSIELPTTFP